MGDTFLVKNINYGPNGRVTITGKKRSGAVVKLSCNAENLCQSTLKPNNHTNKTIVKTNVFKLSDIPKTMRKKGWIKGAHLNERWLKGKNIAMQADDKGKWATSNPKLDYYNPKLFNHEWLSQFDRYNTAVTTLTNNLFSPGGEKAVIKAIYRADVFTRFEDTRTDYFNGHSNIFNTTANRQSLKTYHEKWQTQYQTIDDGVIDKGITYIAHGIDDLWTAFGAFAVYAGIGDYSVRKLNDGWYEIILHSIYVYAVDSYDFMAVPDDYLGHWNKTDFDFFILNKEEVKNHNISYNPRREDTRGSFNPNDLLYPVFNHHYQAYRKKTNKGQDMVVWTKPHLIDMSSKETKYHTTHVHQRYIDELKKGRG